MTRLRKALGSVLLVTLLAGCTTVLTPGAPPVVIQSTPFGSTVIAGGGQAGAPPANLDPDLPGTLPAMGGPRDGIYSGVAVPLSTGGGMCINTQTIDQFRVEGDRVRWGLFRGRIQGNSLQMVQGNTWFFGTFDGNRFNGQITVESRRMGPSCTFMVALAKTGSL